MSARKRQRTGPGKPTLEDIARAAGVSTATASRVLNGSPLVRSELKARVESQVHALGYMRHGAAHALASNRSHTIGAVIPTLDNAIFAVGIESFEQRLEAAGYTLLLAVSNYRLDSETGQVARLLERGVDGMMLIGNRHRRETFAALARARIPHVATWVHDRDAPAANIGFDNRKAAARVAAHLIGLGHRRIAMVAGMTAGNDRAAERLAGVRAELAAHGLSAASCPVIERPYTIEAGRHACARLMACDPPPSAVVCGNDVLALGVLFEAAARGIRVPDALSVTGFDNLPLTAHVSPALTTVDVPSVSMGRLAAEALLDALETGRTTARSAELDAPLLIRSTTAPPPEPSGPGRGRAPASLVRCTRL